MNDLEIFDYIKVSKIQQKTQEEIYTELISKGVTIDQIQKQFENLAANKSPERHEASSSMITPEGIIEMKGRGEILAPSPITVSEKAPSSAPVDANTKLVRALVTFGALFIAIGIFSFVAANWEKNTDTVKVAVLVCVMLASYLVGWLVREKTTYRIVGSSFILLGTLVYGASIFLVAQIFNIQATWPDGFVLWMLGALAVAAALELSGIYVLAILLGFISVFGYPEVLFSNALWGRMSVAPLISTWLLVIATIVLLAMGGTLTKRLPNKEYY